jgi:Replication initiator protein, pSAM2
VLRIPCGNRREDICPPCSQVYRGDARQIIRSGLTGGKGIPETVTTHPCVFATLTAPGFGPVHTTRTSRGGRRLPCRPRRDAHQRRCPHGRDLSCPRHHRDDDPLLGTPLCPDCYDYTGHVLFNALAPELWRRFTIYLPRQLARLAGITQRQLRREVRVRFVKVANTSTAASSTTTRLSGSTPPVTVTSPHLRATPPSYSSKPSGRRWLRSATTPPP